MKKGGLLFLFSILLVTLTGCGSIGRMNAMINETTDSIRANREAIQRNTAVVHENAELIKESNKAIEENRHHLEELSKA